MNRKVTLLLLIMLLIMTPPVFANQPTEMDEISQSISSNWNIQVLAPSSKKYNDLNTNPKRPIHDGHKTGMSASIIKSTTLKVEMIVTESIGYQRKRFPIRKFNINRYVLADVGYSVNQGYSFGYSIGISGNLSPMLTSVEENISKNMFKFGINGSKIHRFNDQSIEMPKRYRIDWLKKNYSN